MNTRSLSYPFLKKWMIHSLFAIAGMLSGVHGASGQSQNSFVVNGRKIKADTLDRRIKSLLGDAGIPGLSLAIIDNNRIVYSNAYGYKKLDTKEKVDKETIFEACS